VPRRPAGDPGPGSSLRLFVLCGIGLAILLALGSVSLFVHVPEGSVAPLNGALRPAGWRLRRPFAHVSFIPLSGRLEEVEVERQTDEGASLRIRLSLAYELAPDRLAKAAAAPAERMGAIQASGLRGMASLLAREALEPFPVAALLPAHPGGPAARTAVDASVTIGAANAPLPRPAAEAVARALRAGGIEPASLVARIGPPASFAESSGAPRPEATGLRVLLIGLDGADWSTIDPLLRAGRLPNLARLIENGARGPLRSYDPMISPLLWTTMVTGVGPDVHGVADFQAIDPATGRRVPITSRFRRVKALWNILSDTGRSSAFVAWWASYPAETVKGVQVSNLVIFQTLRPRAPGTVAPAGITYPQEYFDQIRPSLGTAADLTFEEVSPILHISRAEFSEGLATVLKPRTSDDESENRRMAQQPVPLAISILAGSKNYAAIAADLAARRQDLTAVYFEGIDMMGHRFQHCMPPRMAICPEEDFRRYRDAVTGFYVRQDELLGSILRAAGPETTVMVVSDHGFKTGTDRPLDVLPFTTQQPVEWHREEGILILSGPGARRARLGPRATLFDIAPTLLYLLGLPASEDMPGRVLLEAIDPKLAASFPVRTIPSYERFGAPRDTLVAAGPGVREAEEELLDNLRALGYIGGDAGNAPRDGGPEEAGAPAVAGVNPPTATLPAAAPASGPGADTQVFYHRNLATYFMKRKDYAGAAKQLRLANEKQKLPKNYQLLSEAYLGMGEPRQAIATLEEGLRTLDSMDPESVLWIVQICLSGDGGRPAALDAVRRWASRTEKRPGLDDAIAGRLLEDSGDSKGAAALYWKSLQADPARAMVAQRLMALLPPEGHAELEPFVRRALARDPRIDEYHNLLGVLLAGEGRPREAVESFRRAEELDPENPRFLSNLAAAYAQLGRWDEAAAAYERASTMAPDAGLYMKLGSAYRRLSQPDRALEAFRRARDLGDQGTGPYLGMALAKAEMNRLPEALDLVRQGLDRHPDDSALRSLQDALIRKGRSPG
jgi:tetratricopeptide (TPR) repeat protein/predicted AlkP superfamily pyrophosphatase or phosphodiesterase